MLILGLVLFVIGLFIVNSQLESDQDCPDYELHSNTLSNSFFGVVLTSIGFCLSLIGAGALILN
jgi:hypothetical protein